MSNRFRFPYFYKKRYYNYPHEKLQRFFLSSLCMYVYSRFKRLWHKKPDYSEWISTDFHAPLQRGENPSITWIGHSTFLIECGTLRILTDPIFGDASLLFKRTVTVPLACKELNPIDCILISHNHRDHMDKKTLNELKKSDPFIAAPLGTHQWFHRHTFKKVEEFTWWQSKTVQNATDTVTITFLPAHHWSQRSLFDRNKTLWGSWMICYKEYTIYFAGDTAYSEHFSTIQRTFPTINVALMPIGPCEPHRFMRSTHLNAQQAGKAFLDLNAQHFIPMHWGTFYFGTDTFTAPLTALQTWWKNEPKVQPDQLHILKFGQHWYLETPQNMLKSNVKFDEKPLP